MPPTRNWKLVALPSDLRGIGPDTPSRRSCPILPRDGAFTGLALDAELTKRDADPWCGVQIIDLNSGAIVQWLRIEGGVTELFDVAVLPGVRRPTASAPIESELSSFITYEMA